MNASEKRRHVRRHCSLPLEIRMPGSAFPIKGETTDVSPYGCYVALLYAHPTGVVVDIVLWLGETPLQMRGKVTTSDANVGNGIEFLDMTEEMRTQVAAYLEKIDAPETGPGVIFR
jgi:hypothetical protein